MDDGLKGGGFYLESDSLIQDDANHRVIAEGSVEVRYMGRVLRADEVDYQTQTGVVTARGHVTIVNVDGAWQFSNAITLDKDFLPRRRPGLFDPARQRCENRGRQRPSEERRYHHHGQGDLHPV